jgi:hypothetical protein
MLRDGKGDLGSGKRKSFVVCVLLVVVKAYQRKSAVSICVNPREKSGHDASGWKRRLGEWKTEVVSSLWVVVQKVNLEFGKHIDKFFISLFLGQLKI